MFGAGTPANLDGIRSPLHIDHRRAIEMLSHSLRVDGRAGHNDAKLWSFFPSTSEQTQQEINIEGTFVGFVHDDGVVTRKVAITLGFGQQDAIGHHAKFGLRPRAIGKSNRPPNLASQLNPNLFGHPCGHRTGRDASRLGMTNQPTALKTKGPTQFGQLGAFARTGFPAHDHHPRRLEVRSDCFSVLRDRQPGGQSQVG